MINIVYVVDISNIYIYKIYMYHFNQNKFLKIRPDTVGIYYSLFGLRIGYLACSIIIFSLVNSLV